MAKHNICITNGFMGFDLEPGSEDELEVLSTEEIMDIQEQMRFWNTVMDSIIYLRRDNGRK